MNAQSLIRLLAPAVSIGFAICASGQAQLIAIDTEGLNAFEIDPTTGSRTLLGQVQGMSGFIGALAYDDNAGVMYASSTSGDSLYTFDPVTLQASLVGSYNFSVFGAMHGLEDVPATNRLYGLSARDTGAGNFYEINKATGEATAISLTGFVDSFGSLSYINGTMYAADTTGDNFYTIDLTTGVTTLVGTFGISAANSIGVGFAYSPSTGLLATDNLTDSLYSVDVATGAATLIGPHGSGNILALEFVDPDTVVLGTNYCGPGIPNSTGTSSVLSAFGSTDASVNNLTVASDSMPPNQFGIFVISQTQAFVPSAGGTSNGNLCLGGAIGRFFAANQILSTGSTGQFSLRLPLTAFPQGNGTVAVMPGDTWNFQAWHRDGVGLGSNFSDGLEVLFQ